MKVQEGDVLICACGDCDVELTVTKACSHGSCGECTDLTVECCGKPMILKS